jgi:hypothetical protein
MKSVDGGRRWLPANDGLTNAVIKSIAIDAREPATLAVAAQEQFLGSRGAVFRTRDGGKSWKQIGGDTLKQRVFSVAFDPSRAGVMYAGTEGGHVYRSLDAGDNWTAIDAGGLPQDRGGVTEIQQTMHPQPVYVVAPDPKNKDVLYAATDVGVYRTRDGGATWTAVNNGLIDRRVRAFGVDPKDPQTVYAGTGDMADLGRSGGVFKSINGGDSWSLAGLHGQWVLALAIDPQRPSTVCAGTDQGVSCSDSSGSAWTPVATGGRMRYVLTLVRDPFHAGTLFAGMEGNSIAKVTRGPDSTTTVGR